MNCEKYTSLIDDLVENELDEATAEQVTLHLVDCENCASQFEMLEREKQMYSHYLFEIEPPNYLLNKFQARLEADEQRTISTTATGFISNIFAFLRLNPALVTATVLSVFTVGFTLFNLMTEQQGLDKAIAVTVPTGLPSFQIQLPQSTEKPEVIVPPETKDIVKTTPKATPEAKSTANKQPLVKKSAEAPPIVQMSDEQKQIAQLRDFEIETAKQIEKVELLLRSFRNARFVEGSELYDITYEKQQARKLLQNNVQLRQKAETYGSIFTEEMLSKVEPYLLDIANLDTNPLPEQVLEIKERVKNQNIIASLQGF